MVQNFMKKINKNDEKFNNNTVLHTVYMYTYHSVRSMTVGVILIKHGVKFRTVKTSSEGLGGKVCENFCCDSVKICTSKNFPLYSNSIE